MGSSGGTGWVCRRIALPPLWELLPRLRRYGNLVFLDSAGGEPARWSLLAFGIEPLPAGARDWAGFEAWCTERGLGPGRVGDSDRAGPGGWPKELAEAPFRGGFAGALAYELGVRGERLALPAEPFGQPALVGGWVHDFLLTDHRCGDTWLVLADAEFAGRTALQRSFLARYFLTRHPSEPPAWPTFAGELRRHTDPAEHGRRIEALRARIRRGEVYQANLAHRFTRLAGGDPIAHYQALRARQPVPYAGYVEWGGRRVSEAGPGPPEGALLSLSPELLLDVSRGTARTRPIKGTSPRGGDPAEDEELRKALEASPKDRAELAMIVDLERNDLGRVARPGGVRVPRFPEIESYASVHHLAADVIAELDPGAGAFDVLAALFPGGSITGAPKLAAMEAIAELEGEGRGFFTGSLGVLSRCGRALFNIAIRSPVWSPRPDLRSRLGPFAGELSLRVGGGITWDSRADAEDAETLHKAAALLAAWKTR